MQFKFFAIPLLIPLAFAAPTGIDNVTERPAHMLQERQQGGSSSIISTIISAGLPIIEQLMSSMLPQIESMLTSALAGKVSKRSDGSVVYEVQLPQAYAEALKE